MNLPNKLTLLRIIIVPFVIIAMLVDFPFNFFIAGVLFGAASLTDMFDGKIARKYNLITDFGKFADPLADKILVISVLVCLVKLRLCGALPVIIVLFREFAVTSIRLVAASKGKVVAANMWGKAKTVSQITAISVVFALGTIIDVMQVFFSSQCSNILPACLTCFNVIGQICIWISTIFAVISGVKYIIDNKQFISKM